MKHLKFAFAALSFFATAHAEVTVNKAEGSLESAYAEWAPVPSASTYNVYCDGVKIDNQLIRSYGTYIRADVLGLKAGTHTLKIAPVVNGSEGAATTKTVTVLAQDRAGFAFSEGRVPGVYNTDGTLKSGTVVLYVSENTKNTVTMNVTTNSKGTKTQCKSFQGILNCMKKGYEKTPVDFRFIGNVTDSDSLVAGDMLIDLNSSEDVYVTIEGVGNDATVNGWGIRIKNAQNVEVRNLGIMNVNSNEGDNVSLQQNTEHIWVHNNDFFYGDAGSDADQVKGDGALDCKKSTYITFSYNHFWDNGKCNLLGLSENTTEGLYITYHHNWYDHSDSRHPRVRFYSAHVYNNYYDGNAKYGVGSTLSSSVFVEANFFRNCKYPMLTSMQGSDIYAGSTTRDLDEATFSKEAGGSIKAYNNHMEGSYTFIPYGASRYIQKGNEEAISPIDSKVDFDAYVVSERNEQVPATVKSSVGSNTYNNFDVDNSIMYKYTADAPENAKANVIAYAGRVQGGDFKWTFDNSKDDEAYAVNQPLKNALNAYVGKVKSIQGEGNLPVITPVTPTSSSSITSSSSEKSSSSSVKIESSSSKETPEPLSSSSVEIANSETLPIDKNIMHDFTESGVASDYFEFMGSLSTSKGSVEYKDETLTRCLKFETATSIKFTLKKDATVTLIMNADFVKNVKVDGNKVQANAGVVTITLKAGAHVITKGDAGNVYRIIVNVNENVEDVEDVDENPQTLNLAMSKAIVMRYVSRECRLEIGVTASRLSVLRLDGSKVIESFVPGTSYDLKHLRAGVYMVRLVSNGKVYMQKIFKK